MFACLKCNKESETGNTKLNLEKTCHGEKQQEDPKMNGMSMMDIEEILYDKIRNAIQHQIRAMPGNTYASTFSAQSAANQCQRQI